MCVIMKTSLKNYLLATEMIADNDFLEQYCDLIINNLNNSKIKTVTQAHHIIPKSYFKVAGKPVNNKKENIVHLKYSDHILAHYFLSLCCINKEFKYHMENALHHMVVMTDFDITDLTYYDECYEDLCQQRSERMLGVSYGPCSEDRRNKLLDYYRTHDGNMLGKHWSEEERQKISSATKEGMARWKASITEKEFQDYCENISKKLTGIVRSEETKRKISESRIGKNNPMYGKTSSQRKKVYCIELDQVFDCVKEAAKAMNVADSNICACLKGRSKSCAGYHWQYHEEEKVSEKFKS